MVKRNKTKEKKIKKISFSKYEITKIRMRRFWALIIDWYLTGMIVSLPVTFYLRGDSYLKSEMFNLTSYPLSVGLNAWILWCFDRICLLCHNSDLSMARANTW